MDNTTNFEQGTQPEEMGHASEVQGSGQEGKEQKTFTQEEVNSFIQSRISRMRSQVEKEVKEEYDQKLSDLQSRELKLLMKEKLEERGMDKGLANILTCTDEKDLEEKLNELNRIYGRNHTEKKQETVPGFRQIGVGNQDRKHADPVRKAMGLSREV